MNYAENIKMAMKAKGISQAKLARRLGVTSAAVMQMLRSDMRMSTFEKIAEAMEIPAARLLSDEPIVEEEKDEPDKEEEYRRTHVHGYLRIGERIVEVTCMQELRNAVLACEMNDLK